MEKETKKQTTFSSWIGGLSVDLCVCVFWLSCLFFSFSSSSLGYRIVGLSICFSWFSSSSSSSSSSLYVGLLFSSHLFFLSFFLSFSALDRNSTPSFHRIRSTEFTDSSDLILFRSLFNHLSAWYCFCFCFCFLVGWEIDRSRTSTNSFYHGVFLVLFSFFLFWLSLCRQNELFRVVTIPLFSLVKFYGTNK